MSLKIDGVNNLIKDTNGNEVFSLPTLASAVNFLFARNSVTGAAPSVEAGGDDTNIDLLLTPKGTGAVRPNGPLIRATGITPSEGIANIAMTTADYTVANTEYNQRILQVTGAIGAGRNMIVPTVSGALWIVYNNTTGGFAITVKTAAGTGIAIAATKRAIVYCDGTNVVRVTADT